MAEGGSGSVLNSKSSCELRVASSKVECYMGGECGSVGVRECWQMVERESVECAA